MSRRLAFDMTLHHDHTKRDHIKGDEIYCLKSISTQLVVSILQYCSEGVRKERGNIPEATEYIYVYIAALKY